MPLASVPIVILSAIVVYLAFVVIARIFGARSFTTTTTSDAVFVIMLGAVAGRGILGLEPTPATALVALVSLFSLELLFQGVRKTHLAHRLTHTAPVVVFAEGAPVEEACTRTRTDTDDLVSAMRSAGIVNFSEVQLIILEPSGGYSIIRSGQHVDPRLLERVKGAQDLYD